MTEVIPLSQHKLFLETDANFSNKLEAEHVEYKKSNSVISSNIQGVLNAYNNIHDTVEFSDLAHGLATNFGLPDYSMMDSATFIANHMHNVYGAGRNTILYEDGDETTIRQPPAVLPRNIVDVTMTKANNLFMLNKNFIKGFEPHDGEEPVKEEDGKSKMVTGLTFNNDDNKKLDLQFSLGYMKKDNDPYCFCAILLFALPELINDFVVQDKFFVYKSNYSKEQINLLRQTVLNSFKIISEKTPKPRNSKTTNLKRDTDRDTEEFFRLGYAFYNLLEHYFVGYIEYLENTKNKLYSSKKLHKLYQNYSKASDIVNLVTKKLHITIMMTNVLLMNLKIKLDLVLQFEHKGNGVLFEKLKLGLDKEIHKTIKNRLILMNASPVVNGVETYPGIVREIVAVYLKVVGNNVDIKKLKFVDLMLLYHTENIKYGDVLIKYGTKMSRGDLELSCFVDKIFLKRILKYRPSFNTPTKPLIDAIYKINR